MTKNKWFLNGGRESRRTIRLLNEWHFVCETYENRIADLKKENAELKEKWLQATDEGTSWAHLKSLERENRKLKDQLTKAKNLLAKWVELFKPKSKTALPTPIQVDTEQFLNGEGCPDCLCKDCTKDCGIKKFGLVEVEK